MKGKILESQYNPGYSSYVLKQTKYGTFSSEVFLHDEDKDIDNSFDGCRIAEFDCDTKAYKEKAKWLRQRAIGASIMSYNLIHAYTPEQRLKVIDQLEYLFKEADNAKNYYERRKDYRPIFINNLLKRRRETRNLINKKNNLKDA